MHNAMDEQMNTLLAGKRCTVLGLGVSNRPLAAFLLDHGAIVTVRDKQDKAALGAYADELEVRGVTFITGEDYLDGIDADYVFRTPGIRPDAPAILQALEKGAVLTSEMELFLRYTPATVIGITGSDGKTTTTTLTAELLSAEGKRKVYLGGNIGTPLLPQLTAMTADDVAVVELSSFQLQTMEAAGAPHRAAVTNVTPNHLNWHTDMDEYIAAKGKIVGDRTSRVVLNAGNAVTAEMAGKLPPERVALFSSRKNRYEDVTAACPGALAYYLDRGYIVRDDGREKRNVLALASIQLPGMHNVENYMTAIALTDGMVSDEAVYQVATTFRGVAHRLQYVTTVDGVKYFNSSIDTSPTRTEAALAALSAMGYHPVTICGGYDKKIPLAPLAHALCRYADAVVLTGATANIIAGELEAIKQSGKERSVSYVVEPDFEAAVNAARRTAEAGGVVLLSPGCASFDAFVNFEERGKKFCEIVKSFERG